MINVDQIETHKSPFLSLIIKKIIRVVPYKRILYSRLTNSRYIRAFLPKVKSLLIARLLNGVQITVDVNDYNGRMLFLCGVAYPTVVDVCTSLLNSGSCFLDIGSNYGSIGLLCSNVVGPRGIIHLFEPQPILCQRIRAAIIDNNLGNVHLHEIGLLNRDAIIDMNLPENHSGEASFVIRQDRFSNTIQLQVKETESYLAPLISHRHDVGAKVDIEGAEPYVMPWLIQQTQLNFLVFENTHLTEDFRNSLSTLFEQNKFVLFGLKNTPKSTELCKIEYEHWDNNFHDVVAVRLNTESEIPSCMNIDMLKSFFVK